MDSTHKKYEEYIGDLFGDTVTAVFCDEPTAPRPFAYRKELAEEFLSRCGIDIRLYLPYFFNDVTPDEKVGEIMIQWFEFLSEIFCKNFLEKEKRWCEGHSLQFLGHMDKDDEPNGWLSGGNYGAMRALKVMDVPGVDVISRQIFWERSEYSAKTSFFPRIASSVAAQKGSRLALTESFAVYGNGLTFDQMRYVINYQAMRGINVFNPMLFSYGRRGFLRTGELPHFARSHACYSDLGVFNRYLERLSYLFSVGVRKTKVALYFPQRDMYVTQEECFVKIGERLEKKKIPFDLISDETLRLAPEGELEKGVLRVGSAAYVTVVLPPCRYLSKEGEEILIKFALGGGEVICTDKENVRDHYHYDPTLSRLLPAVTFIGDADGFSVEEIQTKDRLLFIMNETKEKKVCRVQTEGKPYLIDVTFGEIKKPDVADGVCTLTLCGGEIVALFYAEERLPVFEPLGRTERELTSWTCRPKERFFIAKEDFVTLCCHKKERRVRLGDWRRYLGRGFSGRAEYLATFDLPVPVNGLTLELGDVKYTCEAFIGGVSLGVRVMPPYRYEVGADLLQRHNQLVVSVKNTVANEFRYTGAFRKYKKYQMTQYIKRERKFQKSSLPSGLFGPVKIFF